MHHNRKPCQNSNKDSKARESRSRACEWCIASCLEDLSRIQKAPEPHSEVGPQWRREGVAPSEEALLNTWPPRGQCTAVQTATCSPPPYSPPPSPSHLCYCVRASTAVAAAGEAEWDAAVARDWYVYKVKLGRFVFVYCRLCLRLSWATAALKQLDRDQGSPCSDASDLTPHLFKGGIVSCSSESSKAERMRRKREIVFLKWSY